ncbi:polysaccharide biosynthesis tyrosine autokinase [Streptococcus chenjunshii]|uniref:Tyrosine-protein kinase CpsD n=1 Tax=Streptococcus chenjunshii TaxID=2173853 RepID=A0A372KPK9_9STRE|nr:polysaccharide biosynthesis tyrosine autokinase [Streptococcus chenjunshii]AXQ78529.1 polysaccharide biosynthesis tyrosine autokinase [Streptococcus chenjunshii]RFU52009.1 polysaccharide biosynthesis tyrosine autokinase [Streptococcus chenjunshii]RFU54201.1 polysaccharide biosynthesis tyrosine autokinase [Streptococcus chenjunshii]
MSQLELVQVQPEVARLTQDYYNTVRTTIQFKGPDCKTIVITSVQTGEGKTTVAVNLASAFARAGFRTLLLDADTGGDDFSGAFTSSEDCQGLADFLAGQAELSDVIYETDIEHLMVAPAGSKEAAQVNLLQNADFSQMIKTVRDLYDYVIMDTPSIGLKLDAAIIARNADASILVAEAGATKRRFLQKAKSQMQQSGAEFLGVILNKADIPENSNPYKIQGRQVKKQTAEK